MNVFFRLCTYYYIILACVIKNAGNILLKAQPFFPPKLKYSSIFMIFLKERERERVREASGCSYFLDVSAPEDEAAHTGSIVQGQTEAKLCFYLDSTHLELRPATTVLIFSTMVM